MGETDIYKLKHFCQKITNDPDLLPKVIKAGNQEVVRTFCNIGVHRICAAMGFNEFEGLLANQIIDYCDKFWFVPYGSKEEQAKLAHEAAMIGDLVIAGIKDNPHGHVAVVAPEPMVFSGKWKMYVPQVANVGKTNGIIGANYAFKDVPTFFRSRRVVV